MSVRKGRNFIFVASADKITHKILFTNVAYIHIQERQCMCCLFKASQRQNFFLCEIVEENHCICINLMNLTLLYQFLWLGHEKNAIFGWLETSGRSGVAKVSVFDTEVLENLCTHRNLPDTGLMILWYYSRSVRSRTGNWKECTRI